MNTTSFDLLANLMAEENIQVVHGNYPTSMFNIEQRVMYLPMWKDISNNLEILLRAHECGHALYTPVSDIHNCEDFAKIRGAVNILEDARIERLLKQKFPGFKNVFKSAYKEVWDRKFFGTTNIDDINKYNLLDRLNIATKMGVETGVQFYDAIEHEFLVKVMSTQTFEQVLKLARDIVDYCKSNQTETYNNNNILDQQQQQQEMSFDDDDNNSSEEQTQQQQELQQNEQQSIQNDDSDDSDDADDDTNSDNDDESQNGESGDESENMDDEQDGIETKKDGEQSDSGSTSESKDKENEIESKTDSAFHDNEKGLIDYNKDAKVRDMPSTFIVKEQANPNKVIFGYSDFIKPSDPEKKKGTVFQNSHVESLIDNLP